MSNMVEKNTNSQLFKDKIFLVSDTSICYDKRNMLGDLFSQSSMQHFIKAAFTSITFEKKILNLFFQKVQKLIFL